MRHWHILNKTEAKVKGTVTIAASSVPGNYILPRILKQTRLKYPEIDYRMLEGDSSQVIQSVLRFEADLGIGSIRTNHEREMYVYAASKRSDCTCDTEYRRISESEWGISA